MFAITNSLATNLYSLVAVLTFIGVIVFLYFRLQGSSGTLAQKNEIIATYQQSVDALEARLETLEMELKRVESVASMHQSRIIELEKNLAASEARYAELKQYSAPEAVAHFEGMLKAQVSLINQLTEMLVQRNARFDNIDAKLNELTAHLND